MTSSGAKAATPPQPGEVEVSVFGPGYGECIVVHLGQNEWAIIDSCVEPEKSPRTKDQVRVVPESNVPVAIRYLESLGVNVALQVKCFILTHWDDDHITGAAKTYSQASNAKLVVSGALNSTEFEALLASWRVSSFVSGDSGVGEIHKVYAELKARRIPGHSHACPVLASINKEIMNRTEGLPVKIKSLSPSDAGVMTARERFSEISAEKPRRGRIPLIEGNHASVVLSLQIGNLNLLLGGDLQMRADRSYGWFAVVDAGPHARHELFKCAHHGSQNGHHPEIWEKLFTPEPLTVITPFIRGDIRLPTKEDCEKILHHTSKVFLTAPGRPKSFRDDDRGAEKAIKESLLDVHDSPSFFGQVRLRKDALSEPTAPWGIELFGNALSAQDYLKNF